MQRQNDVQSTTPLLEVKGLRKHFPILKGFLRRRAGTVRAVDDGPVLRAEQDFALSGVNGSQYAAGSRRFSASALPDKAQSLALVDGE